MFFDSSLSALPPERILLHWLQEFSPFIAKGAEINPIDDMEGWTPLQAAANFGHKAVVELLQKHGAEE